MKTMFTPAVILFVCISSYCFPGPLYCAEVTNLKTKFMTNEMTVDFDLIGKKGEKDAGVEITMFINGATHASNMLTISGDFGRSVPLGKDKKIIWKHIDDFPAGLEAVFKCTVNTVPNDKVMDESSVPSDGVRATFYALNRQTVTDKRTNLMWTRNANLHKKPITFQDAKKLVEKFNRDRYAGYNDWRLPTKEDFDGLVFFGKKAGWGDRLAHFVADYLMTGGFKNVQPGNYWTSTVADAELKRQYVANTWNGNLRPLEDSNYYYTWPVRDATLPSN